MRKSRTLTPADAWADFYAWVRDQPFWRDIPAKEKLRIYEANAAYKGQRAHGLGEARIKAILEQYGGGRYVFRQFVEVLE